MTLSLQALRSQCLTPWEGREWGLGDVRNWRFPGVFLGVLGDPVAHSISPTMHKAALAVLAQENPIFRDFRYVKLHIKPAELKDALIFLHSRGFKGLNVTIPHKTTILDHLESLTPHAEAVGAVNTLIPTASGFRGENTDIEGLRWALKETAGDGIGQRPWIIWGAGGAARAAVYLASELKVPSLSIINRSVPALKAIEKNFEKLLPQNVCFLTYEALPPLFSDNALHIHATPLGLKAGQLAPILIERLGSGSVVYDMVYVSGGQTALVNAAQKRGLLAADGRRMLAHQGALALALWTQTAPLTDVMLQSIS